MKKFFWLLINKTYKKDLELLYGIGSYVEVQHISLCPTKKIYNISCKLYIGDLNLYAEVGFYGINYLFQTCWYYMGKHDYSFLLNVSYDLTSSDNSFMIK